MAIADTSTYLSVRVALSLSLPATTEQVTDLRSELDTDSTGRGYKDAGTFKAPADLFTLLNDPYTVANPAAQGTVAVGKIDLVTWGQFASSMLGNLRGEQVAAMTAQPPSAPNPLLQILIDTINEQDSKATKTLWVDTAGSAWLSFRPLALALGATNEAALTVIERKSDPDWTPQVQMPSRASAICGVAEIADIAAALALGT
jgi:hypothetical protein